MESGRQQATVVIDGHTISRWVVLFRRSKSVPPITKVAIRNALNATDGRPPTGEDVKKGFESIHNFTLGGLVPPLEISAADHEGGGWVQIFQVKGGKFVKETDWFRAYPEVLAQLLKASE